MVSRSEGAKRKSKDPENDWRGVQGAGPGIEAPSPSDLMLFAPVPGFSGGYHIIQAIEVFRARTAGKRAW